MKKIIITLALSLILTLSFTACGRNNDNNADGSDTKNEGKITESATGTNIIEGVESGVKDIGDNIMGK